MDSSVTHLPPSPTRRGFPRWIFAVGALLLLAVPALLATPAAAVLIESGNGNTTAPLDDPGWKYVGKRSSTTVVYIRNGFVLTANHVGLGQVTLDGVVYDFLPGTAVQIGNADLKVFSIWPVPPHAELPIRSNTNPPNGVVTMIGRGKDQGAATNSDDPTVWDPLAAKPPDPPIEGYLWAAPRAMRWGTNRIEGLWNEDFPLNQIPMESYYTIFDDPDHPSALVDEAQGVNGDSGGAIFAKQCQTWELAGIMHASTSFPAQFLNVSSLYGNATLAADLSFYRDEILTATAVPEPGGTLMLAAGVAFLAGVGRRRMKP